MSFRKFSLNIMEIRLWFCKFGRSSIDTRQFVILIYFFLSIYHPSILLIFSAISRWKKMAYNFFSISTSSERWKWACGAVKERNIINVFLSLHFDVSSIIFCAQVRGHALVQEYSHDLTWNIVRCFFSDRICEHIYRIHFGCQPWN